MQREVANVAAFEKFLRVPLDERKAVLPSRIRCSAKHELRFRWIHVELECPDSRSIAVRAYDEVYTRYTQSFEAYQER